MHDSLRSVWDEPRSPHPPKRVWRDWALVAVLVPLAVLEGLLRPELPWRIASVVLVLALIPTLLWRRTRPLLMVTIGFGVSGLAPVLFPGLGLETYTIAFVLILAYALLRWGSGREVVLGLAVIAGKVLIGAAAGQIGAADLIVGFAVLSTTGALGLALRWRARARQRELEQVKLLERERLARDLHDTVAHHVSAMAIRAQAGLATAPTDPTAATDALRIIEAEASRALAEMRSMVRVLRNDRPAARAPALHLGDLATSTPHLHHADPATPVPGPADLAAPAPSLTDLATPAPSTAEVTTATSDLATPGPAKVATATSDLVAPGPGPASATAPTPRIASPTPPGPDLITPSLDLADLATPAGRSRAGPPVDVDITGDLGALPSPVRTAIFRIAQESVTNARRHARHARRIEVRVSTDPTSVRLQVSDDGESHPRTADAAGYGLIGMAERAGLLGGTCEAGPAPGRGWTVTAVLPRSGSAA